MEIFPNVLQDFFFGWKDDFLHIRIEHHIVLFENILAI